MHGDRIADLRSRNGSLISVYASRPSPGGFGALLSDLVKPIRERAERLGRQVQKSVRADADRIHELADQLEIDSAPGYAIFASELDDMFLLEPLGHSAPNVSTIGPRPYLRPLRAGPRGLRSGILIADRTSARTFVAVDGIVEEIGSPLDVEIGNRSWGGFAGYEEHTVRSRADELTSKLWREAGEVLLERHAVTPFDYLAIGGHDETVEEIAGVLHTYLARLHRQSFVASPQKITSTALRSHVATMDDEVRAARHQAIAGRICDTAWSGGNAVLGLNGVIDAANAHAIDMLAVAGPFSRPGCICDNCGHLTRSGDSCPLCGSHLFEVDDIVGSLMEATVDSGGDVVQISVATPLDREGIGALTRYPVLVS